MFFIYNLILPVIALLLSPIAIIAFIIQPKFRAGFFEKIGFYKSTKSEKETVVFHAVSVGEVNAISTLVKRTRVEHPELRIILTTTTRTGQEVALKTLSNHTDFITYFPYDFCFSIFSFFKAFKPSKIIIAETEIWPCLVSIASIMGVNVYIVNGRISPNSYKGYKRFSFFFKQILSKYELILMQSQSDADRILKIGAPEGKTRVMGNLKFDISKDLSDEEITSLKNELEVSNSRVFIAASTHSGEDEIVLEVYTKLKSIHGDIKLLIAPRHPQRYEQVESLTKSTGFEYGKRSNEDKFSLNEIIMLDTMGELAKLFSIAHLAFIGGSFSNTGGHNPLEALIWNKPVISGPTVFNFKDVYKLLVEKQAAIIVDNKEQFFERANELFSDESKYKKACDLASEVFDSSKGAVDYVLKTIF